MARRTFLQVTSVELKWLKVITVVLVLFLLNLNTFAHQIVKLAIARLFAQNASVDFSYTITHAQIVAQMDSLALMVFANHAHQIVQLAKIHNQHASHA